MKNFGQTIKDLRTNNKLPLRTVAAFLDIDQAILSKIENGKRKIARPLVLKLAKYYKVTESDLLVVWLADKLVYELSNEKDALKALQVAEEKVTYFTSLKSSKVSLTDTIKNILKIDGRVAKAWLFGSVSRGDEKSMSDIDIIVELNKKKKYSMFDLLDISFLIENKINRRVDLVEKGYLKDFALKPASNDMVKIYG